MREYELCLIFHPESSEEDIANILDSIGKSIAKLKGSILKTEKWGKKNLKYHIKKQSKGYYSFLYYLGNNEILREIERIVRFNESVLRYNTVRLEKNFKVENPEEALPASKTEAVKEEQNTALAGSNETIADNTAKNEENNSTIKNNH